MVLWLPMFKKAFFPSQLVVCKKYTSRMEKKRLMLWHMRVLFLCDSLYFAKKDQIFKTRLHLGLFPHCDFFLGRANLLFHLENGVIRGVEKEHISPTFYLHMS